jgi:hypothetical protein
MGEILESQHWPNGWMYGHCTQDEDNKPKEAVEKCGGKNWDAIAGLISSRKKNQCWTRCQCDSDVFIEPTAGHNGGWTAYEDSNKVSFLY